MADSHLNQIHSSQMHQQQQMSQQQMSQQQQQQQQIQMTGQSQMQILQQPHIQLTSNQNNPNIIRRLGMSQVQQQQPQQQVIQRSQMSRMGSNIGQTISSFTTGPNRVSSILSFNASQICP